MAIVSTPQEHAVAIIVDGSKCKISPGEVLAAKADQIRFFNLTDGPVTVIFPDTSIFTEGSFSIASQDSYLKTFKDGVMPGAYSYTAYGGRTLEFAHASIPRIIIFPDVK
jgi:hypothetical protein